MQHCTMWSQLTDDARLVTIPLQTTPPIAMLTDLLVHKVADSLQMLWPEWFSGKDESCDFASDIPERVESVANRYPGIQAIWLREAWRCCQLGRAPISRSSTPAFQIRQLGIALGGSARIVAIVVHDKNLTPSQLTVLSRSAEWLAREARVAVLLVLHPSLKSCIELDGVNFTSVEFIPSQMPDESTSGTSAPSDRRPLRAGETKYLVSPIIGRPHPGSPGEIRLAQQLARDEELSALFQFNVPVISRFGNRFLVDLLWQAGRIVVEIDGYGIHSKLGQFNADRERDYELLVSDYLVLRLPHDFVVEDPILACERIRDIVRFRQQSLR